MYYEFILSVIESFVISMLIVLILGMISKIVKKDIGKPSSELKDEDHHTFDKALAKINAQLTIVTTASSIFAVFGVSLFILGVTTGLTAISKAGDELTLLIIISSVYSQFGIYILIIGISVLILAQFAIPRKIDKLK